MRGAQISPEPQPARLVAVPFSATLASEWTKLTSLRSTRIIVVLSLVLAAAATAIAGVLTGASWDEWSAADRADFDPILFPLVGGIFAGVLLTTLGVIAVTSEYSTGMIRLTLTATPRRGRVLFAKAAVVAAITLATAAVAMPGIFLIGQAIYRVYGLETASLADTDTLRAVLGSIALAPVFPVIAVAVAALLRSTAGSILTILGVVFIPDVLGSMLPSWWRGHVVAALPGPATDRITIAHLTDLDSSLPSGVAALAVVVWVGAFLGAAYVVLRRRDA